MSNEKFKVKFGLAVGDTAATVDGTTGNIVTNGSVTLNGSSSGSTTLTQAATGSVLTYVLPTAAGASSTVLTNDGAGNLSWALPGGGGSTFGNITVGVVTDNTISTTTGDLVIDSATNIVTVDADEAVTGNITSTKGVYAKGIFDGTFTDGVVIDYATGNARISTGASDTLTFYNGGVAGTQLGQFSTAGDLAITGDLTVTGNDIKSSGGTTALTMSGANLSTTGNIANTVNSIYAGGNRTWTGGDAYDITRNRGTVGTDTYSAYMGLLSSNANKTTTLGARAGVVIRSYGQNITSGTSSTLANPILQYESTRGTPATPVAIGSGDPIGAFNVHGNAGTSAGTAYWTNDNYTAPPAQQVFNTTQAWSATAAASATFVANFVAGTTMTVASVSSGTIGTKQEVRYVSGGSGAFTVNNTFTIVGQLTSSAAAAASTTATASNKSRTIVVASAAGIVVGQLVTGTGIPTKTYVGAINGTTISLINAASQPVGITASITASAVNFYTAGGAGTYELNASPYGSTVNTVTCTTTAVTLGTNYIVRLQPDGHTLTSASRPNVLNVSPTFTNIIAQNSDPTATSFQVATWPTTVVGGTNRALMKLGLINSELNSENVSFYSLANTLNNLVYQTPASSSGNGSSVLSMTQITESANTFPVVNFSNYRSTDSTNYTPTQSGDVIGAYKFNGNANTGTSPGAPGGPASQISVLATENWTSTKNGSQILISVQKTGGPIGDVNIISGASNLTTFRSDAFTLQDSSSVNLIGNNITYNRVYGQFQWDATVTPAAANTAYVFPIQGASGIVDFANIASVANTSQIIPGAAGMYKLQFSVQVDNADNGSEHTAYIWWRKNGVDVPASMGRVTVPKAGATIAGWDNMISSSNTTDYWELAYAVDDTQVTFPYFGTTAFGPATACLFITLVPIGA